MDVRFESVRYCKFLSCSVCIIAPGFFHSLAEAAEHTVKVYKEINYIEYKWFVVLLLRVGGIINDDLREIP